MPVIVYSRPSFQSLFIEVLCKGIRISTATGFVVEVPGYGRALVTNKHVVTGRDFYTEACLDRENAALPDVLRVYYKPLVLDQPGIAVDHQLYDANGEPMWCSSTAIRADVVALPLPNRSDIAHLPYSFTSHSQFRLQPMDRVSIVGFPFGARGGRGSAVWAAGFVATQPNVMLNGEPCFLVDSRTRKGQSGSPVITFVREENTESEFGVQLHRGKVVLLGIYSGRINPDSDIGRVWTADCFDYLVVLCRSRFGEPVA